MEYAGWHNFATWQFCLNLGSIENNYNYIKKYKKELLQFDNNMLLDTLINSLDFYDIPDKDNIYMEEVRKYIEEF